MLLRDGKSNFVESLKFGKRGTILKVANKAKELQDEPGADTEPEAKNVLKKFDKSKDIPDSYIDEHVKMIEEMLSNLRLGRGTV